VLSDFFYQKMPQQRSIFVSFVVQCMQLSYTSSASTTTVFVELLLLLDI